MRDRFYQRAALIASLALGVNMAQPIMRDAHAQEKGDVSKVQKATDSVATNMSGIRKTFSEMKSNDIPAQVNYADPNVKKLLSSLEALDDTLKPYNNGSSSIPVSGKTDKERYQSLNRWLGRDKDAPLTEDSLVMLEQKVMVAAAATSASSTAAAVAGTVPATTTSSPPVTTAVPVKVDRRAEYAQTLENLAVVAEHGSSSFVRTQAQSHIDKINTELDGDARQSKLEKYDKDAQTFLNQNLSKAQEKAAEGTHVAQLSPEERSGSAAAAGEIVSQLEGITSRSSSASQQKKDDANQVINLAIDSWLLGQGPRERMLSYLGKAKDALLSDNDADRKKYVAKAQAVFKAEQDLYRARLTQVVIPVAQASLEAVGTSEDPKIPTRAKLEAEGKKDGTTYYPFKMFDIASNSFRTVKNGHEDVREKFAARLEEAKKLQASPKLSYHVVSDMQEVAVAEDNVLQTIVDLWSFYQNNRAEDGDKSTIWTQYALAISTLMDPNVSPFNNYPKQVQESIARLYLRRELGRVPTDAEIAKAVKEIIPTLMTNTDYRYDEAIQNFYNPASSTFPKSEGEGLSIARLRTFRESLAYRVHGGQKGSSYRKYLTGLQVAIIEDPEFGTQINNESVSEEELHSQERLDFAREILGDAVEVAKKAGIKDDDPMMKMARNWLKKSKGVPQDRIPVVADALYHMSLGLTAIAEAELWYNSKDLRRPLSAEDKKEIQRTITQARKTFYWNFGSTSVDPGWHPNITEELANSAVRMMAPPALANTERSVVGTSFMYYDDPTLSRDFGEYLKVNNKSHYKELFEDHDTSKITESDRLAAAAISESRYIGFLAAVRKQRSFAVSDYEKTDSWSRMAQGQLSYSYGRDTPPPVKFGKFQMEDRGSSKETLTAKPLDIHIVPYSEDPQYTIISNVPYQDEQLAKWGTAYNQVYRLNMMVLASHSTPQLLREIDPNPYIARMDKAATTYGTKSPKAQLVEVNDITLDILDERINQLSERLDGEITLAAGGKYKRKELADSPDPQKRYVQRAIWALRDLRRIREDLVQHKSGDLYERPVNPDQAIAVAEIAIQSLDDSILEQLKPPKPKPVHDLDGVSLFVPSRSIDIQRYTSFGHERRVRFTARQVYVKVNEGPDKGKVYTLEQFERAQATAKKASSYDVNLTYYWFAYQYLGRKDNNGQEILYLRNPNFDKDSKDESKRNEYAGVLIRGATYTDGTKAGDVVVRVRRNMSSDPSEHEWIPMYQDGRGRIRKEDVLYQVQAGTRKPIRNDQLNRNLRDVAIQSTVNKANVPENGDAYPALVVYPHGVTQK